MLTLNITKMTSIRLNMKSHCFENKIRSYFTFNYKFLWNYFSTWQILRISYLCVHIFFDCALAADDHTLQFRVDCWSCLEFDFEISDLWFESWKNVRNTKRWEYSGPSGENGIILSVHYNYIVLGFTIFSDAIIWFDMKVFLWMLIFY